MSKTKDRPLLATAKEIESATKILAERDAARAQAERLTTERRNDPREILRQRIIGKLEHEDGYKSMPIDRLEQMAKLLDETEEPDANARIASAMPEMLAMLESLSHIDGLLGIVGVDRWNRMAGIVAKAKGEPLTAHATPAGIVALDQHPDQVEGRAS